VWHSSTGLARYRGQVRKGEHGSRVVYADRFKKTEADESGNDVEQIENLPENYYDKPAPVAEKMQLIEASESFFTATGATFRHGGNMAYYAPAAFLCVALGITQIVISNGVYEIGFRGVHIS
jgi:antirestriction protein ArdC